MQMPHRLPASSVHVHAEVPAIWRQLGLEPGLELTRQRERRMLLCDPPARYQSAPHDQRMIRRDREPIGDRARQVVGVSHSAAATARNGDSARIASQSTLLRPAARWRAQPDRPGRASH
jgi:hypothetical protein